MIDVALMIIGNEILSGHIQDLNVRSLALWLKKRGHRLAHVEICPDQESDIRQRLQVLRANYAVVITSGGLGPTADDITKQVIAGLLNAPLASHPKAIELVTGHYQRLKRPWTPETNHYHMLPMGVEPLYNACGLAPGLYHHLAHNDLLCFPGVPSEFNGMLDTHLPEILKARLASYGLSRESSLASIVIRTQRVPEEKIFFQLSPHLWKALERFGSVSSLPRSTGVDIVITVPGDRLAQDQRAILQLPEMAPLLPNIWHVGDESLAEVVLLRARAARQTIAAAESCTGGLLASHLTDIPGSSDVFLASMVCYHNAVKEQVLKVNPATLQKHGAVSREVVAEMVQGVLQLTQCDLAVATSGIAGPGGGTEEKPVGTLALAVASRQQGLIFSDIFQMQGNRLALKERFASAALSRLLEYIPRPQ